ncbi:MAG: dockerin type I repeat-containing protein [Clostridia bacterium]|nr:dockerin type I repeat-containing protein [Clostridia bacterium]
MCKTAENEASLFDLNDRLVKKYGVTLQGTEQITTICSSSENTLLVYKDKDGGNYFAKIIDANEDLDEESPSAPDDGQSSENTADEPTKDTIAKVLGPYDIDDENKYISKIDLGTTVAAFKQNLNLDGKYTVTFKNYTGKEITNGKLGTGSVVSFWKNGTLVKEYTVVVDFDVSGEGNFNSRDIDYMYNQIFDNGKTSLTGEYFISGDTNKDGVIDTVDLLYMKKAMASEK